MNTSDKSVVQFPDLNTKIIPDIPELKWNELIAEQQYDNFICEIREQIITQAFEEIYKKSLESRVIHYIVDCVYESWQKIIALNFLFYDPCNEYYMPNSSWTPDVEPEPCLHDSWSRGFMSSKTPDVKLEPTEKLETVLSDYQLIKLSTYPTANYFTERISIPELISDDKILEESRISLKEIFVTQYEPYVSELYVPFTCTSPASSVDAFSDNIIVNKIISDSKTFKPEPSYKKLFYKNIRSMSVLSSGKLLSRKKLPAYPCIEPLNTINLMPLRLNVISQLKDYSASQQGLWFRDGRSKSVSISREFY